MAGLLDTLRTVGRLKKDAATLRHGISELEETAAAARGEGLVRACVSCAEDIDLVRVSDGVLEALRGPLLADMVCCMAKLPHGERPSLWAWVDKDAMMKDRVAYVRDSAVLEKILHSWSNTRREDLGSTSWTGVHMPVMKHLLPTLRECVGPRHHGWFDHMYYDMAAAGTASNGTTFAATAEDWKELVASIEDIRKSAAERIAIGAAGIIEGVANTSPAIKKDIDDRRKRLADVEARLAAANDDIKNMLQAAGAEDAWETVFA